MSHQEIGKEYTFAASHQLWRNDWDAAKNEEVFGKCSRLHGHNYTVRVTVAGDLDSEGMVFNYYALDDVVAPLIEALDHRHLNDIMPLPTAENLVDFVWLHLKKNFPVSVQLSEVAVQETPKTFARRHR